MKQGRNVEDAHPLDGIAMATNRPSLVERQPTAN